MAFLSEKPDIAFKSPLFAVILGNTLLSTVPGISGAGPGPEKTLLTPNIDAELITNGAITSTPANSNTPTGCPTPATITRAMMVLTGLQPLFINAGLRHVPTVPCLDAYGEVAGDPRKGDALPSAERLFAQGERMGSFLSSRSDLLILGECVPGGTTTALCLLRALGYEASVSSSFVDNPVSIKEEVCRQVLARVNAEGKKSPPGLVRALGDPMMPVAAGIAKTYTGTLVLAGGTQMLAVGALIKALGQPIPPVVTTSYVRDDPTANVRGACRTDRCPRHVRGPRVRRPRPCRAGTGTVSGKSRKGRVPAGRCTSQTSWDIRPTTIRKAILATVRAYS